MPKQDASPPSPTTPTCDQLELYETGITVAIVHLWVIESLAGRVLTDVLGRPAVIHLTPGNASDVTAAPDVLAAAPGHLRRLVADRGYDADALRRELRAKGTKPIIPGRRCRKRPIRHDTRRYRDRWRIEAAMGRLKDFRRVATRYDKLAANFGSAVAIAAIVAFWC